MSHKKFNWKVFITIWLATIFGVIAIIPYSLAVQGASLEKIATQIPIPLLLAIQIGQNAIMFGVATMLGLFLANRIGLGAPILEGFFARQRVREQIRSIILPSVILGVVAALIIIALDVFLFSPALKAELGVLAGEQGAQSIAKPAAWQGFFASFYGGINEEVLLRLFLLTSLAWLGKFVSHTAEGRPTLAVLWIANILTAILFGLGHLPVTAMVIPLTPLVITRAIVLNGLAGLAFGYLYWRRGIESAMLSHFSADIVLHVLLAM
ncbi:MAG: CPBP family intramembrane metalloprotease [Chloroflexi bacterium]|nr:CPBP family intramembrane metalloprotease [Chloroflexota bacterium]